jgi:LPXTG-motif cell wall-anchored protein
VRAAQTGGETPDSSTGADTTGEAAQTDDGPSLPNTGADTVALLLLGWLLLAAGWAVQRRIRTGAA